MGILQGRRRWILPPNAQHGHGEVFHPNRNLVGDHFFSRPFLSFCVIASSCHSSYFHFQQPARGLWSYPPSLCLKRNLEMWNKSDLCEEAHGKYIYLFLIPFACMWDWCHLRLDWLIELLLVIKHSDGKIHQSCFWRNKVWGTFLAASLRQRMPCDPLLYNRSSS